MMSAKRSGGVLLLATMAGVAPVFIQSATAQSTTPASIDQAEEVKLPEGEVALGTVRVPTAVLADGERLSPGTYRLRLTAETAAPPNVAGQTEKLERWVEFLQGSTVKARVVASIVPSGAIAQVAEGSPPRQGSHRVDRLKEDDYLRIWINKSGDHVLLHMPIEKGS